MTSKHLSQRLDEIERQIDAIQPKPDSTQLTEQDRQEGAQIWWECMAACRVAINEYWGHTLSERAMQKHIDDLAYCNSVGAARQWNVQGIRKSAKHFLKMRALWLAIQALLDGLPDANEQWATARNMPDGYSNWGDDRDVYSYNLPPRFSKNDPTKQTFEAIPEYRQWVALNLVTNHARKASPDEHTL